MKSSAKRLVTFRSKPNPRSLRYIGENWPISEIDFVKTDAGLLWAMIENDREPLSAFVERISRESNR